MVCPRSFAHPKRGHRHKSSHQPNIFIRGFFSYIDVWGTPYAVHTEQRLFFQHSASLLYFLAQSGQSVLPEMHFQPSAHAILDSRPLQVSIPFSKSVLRLLAHEAQVTSKYVSSLIFTHSTPFLFTLSYTLVLWRVDADNDSLRPGECVENVSALRL